MSNDFTNKKKTIFLRNVNLLIQIIVISPGIRAFNPYDKLFFGRGHATLELAVSVGRSEGRSHF